MSFQQVQMSKMLDWFESANVNQWNLAILEKAVIKGDLIIKNARMIGHDHSRDRKEANKCVSWLALENMGKGKAGIERDCYIRPAWHHSAGVSASWPVVFLDDVPSKMLTSITSKALIIKTSFGRYHVWLAVNRSLTQCERKIVQQQLQTIFKSDSGSISGEHFGRCAGFKNIKRSGCWVTIEKMVDGLVLDVTEMLKMPLLENQPKNEKKLLTVQTSTHNQYKSESELEFGYVISKIRYAISKGLDIRKVCDNLESELALRVIKRGKHTNNLHAINYAKITVYNAKMAAGLKSHLYSTPQN